MESAIYGVTNASTTNSYVGVNFYDMSVWRGILLVAVLFLSLLVANIVKRKLFPKSLIPNSVLGGCMLLIISTICYYTSGKYLFNFTAFTGNGTGVNMLEAITFHCLGIGFVAMSLRPERSKVSKERTTDVINTGVATVSNYLLQAVLGIATTLIASKFIKDLAPGSGMLLCFGYGQGTGQALNIGKNFDAGMGNGGTYANMGLSLAALGFLVASVFGVIYLNHLRRKGEIAIVTDSNFGVNMDEILGENEVPMNESVDKLSIQVAFVFLTYGLAYLMMLGLGKLVPSMQGTIFGFNFIFGVVSAVIIKGLCAIWRKMGWMHYEYCNTYLLNRISGFAFDVMIVAGICAIQIHLISNYIGTILILGAIGAYATFTYDRIIAKKVFPTYEHEMFMAMFGMYTGTASTGMMLLREIDPELKTYASENLVYQNFPAIVLGFPLLFVANALAADPTNAQTAITMGAIAFVALVALNIFLFRKNIFKKK